MIARKRILLVITGGIAAYKSLELIRRLREEGASVCAVLTKAGAEFVTPLSVAALTGEKVYSELFSLTDETEIGHIQLSRQADLVVVVPASADFLAKMAQGRADDLASTLLLATDKETLAAPAMNVRMWEHPATQANLTLLKERGVHFVGPGEGAMACGEYGPGRMAEPREILQAIKDYFGTRKGPLSGLKAVVTSGPTHEPIDPVRYIANRSSGKQGHAIAAALRNLGADTTLVSGPTRIPAPDGVKLVAVESAREMLAACQTALPADIAVCAAAVADWRVENGGREKIKKAPGAEVPQLQLAQNPDILATLSKAGAKRPALVVGFAAETEKVEQHAREKLARKGCDWILANDVSEASGTFGGDDNTILFLSGKQSEQWERLSKQAVAERLAQRIAAHFKQDKQ